MRRCSMAPLTLAPPSGDDEPEIPRHRANHRYRLYSDAEIEKLAGPEYLIPGILPRESAAMIYGAAGSTKSFLALDMALCVATGTPWMGRPVQRGCALYVAAEGASGY